MSSEGPSTTNRLFLFFSFLLVSVLSGHAQDGKTLFNSKCAACHSVFIQLTGPALGGFQDRENGKWTDINELTSWIRNPVGYMQNDAYTSGLKDQFNINMQAFPDIQEEEVSAIAAYINDTYAKGPGGGGPKPEETQPQPSGGGAILFGIISIIMALIALILMQVNSNLKKLSDDVEGVKRPEPVPFYKNKVYIALFSCLLFIVGGYYVTRGAIDFGRQKTYQPDQPIYYSHRVHAGVNQINCLYCHSNAMQSKSATIPSTNVCMNCHKAITSYEKGPVLHNDAGDEINGTR